MKIAGKLSAIVALIVAGFLLILGLLVGGMAAATTLQDLQLQAAEVTTDAYRLSTQTGHLLVANRALSGLYETWRESAHRLDRSIEQLRTHRGGAMLDDEVGVSIARTVEFWRLADPGITRVEDSITAVLETDRIPEAMKTGLTPTIQHLLTEDDIAYDVVISLNGAQSSVTRIAETNMALPKHAMLNPFPRSKLNARLPVFFLMERTTSSNVSIVAPLEPVPQ